MPFHSVIISNFNYGRFLRESVGSVLNQSVTDFELLLCDDGSTDDSLHIMEGFRQSEPECIRIISNENRGQAEVFNEAVASSRGKLISFLDADDTWNHNKLRWLEEVFKKYPHASLFQHNLEVCFNTVQTGIKNRNTLESGDYFRKIQESYLSGSPEFPSFTPTSGLSFPAHILEKILPIPKVFKTCADGYLTRTAFSLGEVIASQETYGSYRLHGNNAIFNNKLHDRIQYTNRELIPALNQYFSSKQIRMKFVPPKRDKSRESTTIQKFSSKIVPHHLRAKNDDSHIELASLLERLAPRSLLYIRSDRNAIAPFEIENILPDNCLLEILTTSKGIEELKNVPRLHAIFSVEETPRLEWTQLPADIRSQLKSKSYDLVMYGNSRNFNRSNIRNICKNLHSPWFGYSGKGRIRLESLDVLRLYSLPNTARQHPDNSN